MNDLQKKLNRNIISDYFYTFINNLNMSGSIWVLYLAYKGMSLMEIGLLEGIYHITGLLIEIPSGAAADLLGRRKTMLVGRILMVISCIIMLFSNGFIGFAMGFIFQSLSGSLHSGSEEALVYDSLKFIGKADDYPRINGRLNMLIEIAQGIATVVGGIIAEYSYTYCYLVCIIISLLGLIPLLFMTEPLPVATVHSLPSATDCQNPHHGSAEEYQQCPNTTHTVNEKTAVVKRGNNIISTIKIHFLTSGNILKNDKQILRIILFYSALFTAYNTLFFYSQQYFYEVGLNKIQISVIMLFAGIISCIAALSSDYLCKLLGNKAPVMGALMIVLGIGCFAFSKLPLSIGAFLVATFFNALLYPIQSNDLNQRIPSEQRATLISVSSMFYSVFMILLFPLVGALADVSGLAIAFGFVGGISLVGILLSHKALHLN